MAARRRVWVTRSAPGAEATAERLRALGFDTLVAPLLQLTPVGGASIDLDGVAALAFTSANGVRAFAEKSHERGLKVFAVGAATAKAAREARFSTVLSTDGDVKALAAALATRKREIAGTILHPGAAEPAGDLRGALAKHDMEVRAVALYESTPADIGADITDALPDLHAVVLHSPKAAQALAKLLKAHPAPQLRAWCLSKAVARPLARAALADVAAAAKPNEDALMALIAEAT
jgi:uroporphyrinogen-III synthase